MRPENATRFNPATPVRRSVTTGTNSAHDTTVTDPRQIEGDLEQAGFESFVHEIRPSFDDGHPFWIYVKAIKPA